jgi:hypothetical protein
MPSIGLTSVPAKAHPVNTCTSINHLAWGWRLTAFVDFLSIYNRFSRRGEAETHSVAPDRDDSDANLMINDDLLTDLARKHEHGCLLAL